MILTHSILIALSAAAELASAPPAATTAAPAQCAIETIVLGVSQDAGAPQLGQFEDPAWRDPSLRRLAASLGLVDRRSGERFLFEATPDMREQLQRLDVFAPQTGPNTWLNGIFLTHAHIGHYAGLMFLGLESANAHSVPVYAMPRMRRFLSSNGPWDQLIRLRNIVLRPIEASKPTTIGAGLTVTAYRVPHRDEYSETVGYVVRAAGRSMLFLPDIDSWDRWRSEFGIRLEDMIGSVDIAYVDATFYDDHELPGRDMSAIPHPRIVDTMKRLSPLAADQRRKIRFIHLNHTNSARYPNSPARAAIARDGFGVAEEGERVCLLPAR
jgi:pyrroloquinoline quinone biosynthesis protein B